MQYELQDNQVTDGDRILTLADGLAATADAPGDLEVRDQGGSTWIRKHPSAEVCAVLLTIEDLDYLAAKHRDAAARSEGMGDGTGLARHALARARFTALSKAQAARQSSDGVEPHSGRQVMAQLNGAGFDQEGRQWVPRRPTEDLLCVPLSAQELMVLHGFYTDLSALSMTKPNAAKWAMCEKKRETLMRQVGELDKDHANRLREQMVSSVGFDQSSRSSGSRC